MSAGVEGCTRPSTQDLEATSANLCRKECLGMQRSPKAMPLRPTNVDLLECDCHLPTMVSAGRMSCPVPLMLIGGSLRSNLLNLFFEPLYFMKWRKKSYFLIFSHCQLSQLVLFLVGVQPFSTTLFGVPFPLPTPQGRRAQQLKTRLECWIRGLHEASTQGKEQLFRKECLGMQRSPKAMPLCPTNVDLPECDCQ